MIRVLLLFLVSDGGGEILTNGNFCLLHRGPLHLPLYTCCVGCFSVALLPKWLPWRRISSPFRVHVLICVHACGKGLGLWWTWAQILALPFTSCWPSGKTHAFESWFSHLQNGRDSSTYFIGLLCEWIRYHSTSKEPVTIKAIPRG